MDAVYFEKSHYEERQATKLQQRNTPQFDAFDEIERFYRSPSNSSQEQPPIEHLAQPQQSEQHSANMVEPQESDGPLMSQQAPTLNQPQSSTSKVYLDGVCYPMPGASPTRGHETIGNAGSQQLDANLGLPQQLSLPDEPNLVSTEGLGAFEPPVPQQPLPTGMPQRPTLGDFQVSVQPTGFSPPNPIRQTPPPVQSRQPMQHPYGMEPARSMNPAPVMQSSSFMQQPGMLGMAQQSSDSGMAQQSTNFGMPQQFANASIAQQSTNFGMPQPSTNFGMPQQFANFNMPQSANVGMAQQFANAGGMPQQSTNFGMPQQFPNAGMAQQPTTFGMVQGFTNPYMAQQMHGPATTQVPHGQHMPDPDPEPRVDNERPICMAMDRYGRMMPLSNIPEFSARVPNDGYMPEPPKATDPVPAGYTTEAISPDDHCDPNAVLPYWGPIAPGTLVIAPGALGTHGLGGWRTPHDARFPWPGNTRRYYATDGESYRRRGQALPYGYYGHLLCYAAAGREILPRTRAKPRSWEEYCSVDWRPTGDWTRDEIARDALRGRLFRVHANKVKRIAAKAARSREVAAGPDAPPAAPFLVAAG